MGFLKPGYLVSSNMGKLSVLKPGKLVFSNLGIGPKFCSSAHCYGQKVLLVVVVVVVFSTAFLQPLTTLAEILLPELNDGGTHILYTVS
jgi:hypothetical protein